ncbi:MAG: Eco57I restriction-modification methylase domain-containing protein [Roseiflexaceae bacterium]
MSQTKTRREKKRQLGQFLTPPAYASQLLRDIVLDRADTVLEPCMGDGSFIMPLIEKFLPLYEGSLHQRLDRVLTENVYGVEIDSALYRRCLAQIEARWGYCPARHNLVQGDFFRHWFTLDVPAAQSRPDIRRFDYIVGNPPFGGTIDPRLQDQLDRQFGFRDGDKIKKETYAFFIVKCLDILKDGGRLRFICSDTFLTIQTMRGLRRLLMSQGAVEVATLSAFSDETNHAMVVLDFRCTGGAAGVTIDGRAVARGTIELTGNASWRVTEDLAPYFRGPKLGDYVVATSGMTTGKNDLFIRQIIDGAIVEPYAFEFFDDPISVANELRRARLGVLSPRKIAQIAQLERASATRRNVRIAPRPAPLRIALPHPDYRPYNKALKTVVYARPTHVIYWKDDGDAARTFKRNGNWYLHGVGGQRYFGREGLTWQLIAQRLNARYLPPGYVLDSGAPCAFLRPGVDPAELYFILGWALAPLCERLLKEVVNHTKNIQGKDFERLPYPFWVPGEQKQAIIEQVRRLVAEAVAGRVVAREDEDIRRIGGMFESGL